MLVVAICWIGSNRMVRAGHYWRSVMYRRVLLMIAFLVLSSCAQDDSVGGGVPGPPTTMVPTSTSIATTTSSATPLDSNALQVAAGGYEEWIAAWEAHDPDRIAAVFTPDGIYINPLGEVVVGREAMKAYAPGHVVRDGQLGEIEQIEPGVFRAPFVFEAEGPMGWQSGSGDLELELDGELAARIEFVTFDGFKST